MFKPSSLSEGYLTDASSAWGFCQEYLTNLKKKKKKKKKSQDKYSDGITQEKKNSI